MINGFETKPVILLCLWGINFQFLISSFPMDQDRFGHCDINPWKCILKPERICSESCLFSAAVS